MVKRGSGCQLWDLHRPFVLLVGLAVAGAVEPVVEQGLVEAKGDCLAVLLEPVGYSVGRHSAVGHLQT